MAAPTPPLRLGAVALAMLASLPGVAWAQQQAGEGGPDLRNIDPYMMLVVDTSGSMERLPACECVDAACLTCTDGRSSLPDCSLANVAGQPPVDVNGNELKKNRWAMTLEALTGPIKDFQCESLARTQANGMSYDIGFPLPYNQPWACNGTGPCGYLNPTTTCTTDADCAGVYKWCSNVRSPLNPSMFQCSSLGQTPDGILDQYNGAVDFGLMTYDGMDTYFGHPPLVPSADFSTALSEDEPGLWSYGGPKDFHYPNCTTDYAMDTGARSSLADEGALISMTSCDNATSNCPSWCSSCPASQSSLNADIQRSLLATRPYGGTPIAASLDDLYTHLKDDLTGDSYGACRDRFALLITDGYPDDDYRDYGCDCWQNDDALAAGYCGGPEGNCPDAISCPNHPDNMMCPYPLPEDAAAYLLNGRPLPTGGTDPPQLEKLFVVGLSVDETSAEGMAIKQRLDAIAFNGGTENALFADDLPTLFQRLTDVMNSVIEPLSRSVPAFSGAGANITLNGNEVVEYQVSTGFQKGFTQGGMLLPWTGILEKRSFTCRLDATLGYEVPQAENLSAPGTSATTNGGDRFHEALNGPLGDTRDLWTVIPSGGATPNDHLYWGNAGDPCGSSGCSKAALASVGPTLIDPTYTTTDRDFIVNWMHGAAGTARANRRLGDIIHSNPVIVGTPRYDIGDEVFNTFRAQLAAQDSNAGRPLVVYVGTNDGILHAFSMEERASLGLSEGEEIWGFVPPYMFDKLPLQIDNHRLSMDGTPAVKNVFFNRVAGAAAVGDEYHTVLIMGMRSGGNSYVALDVTDPLQPKFLWQFTDPDMGLTYGQAAIGQTFYTDNTTVKNRAVAILPGGTGIPGDNTDVPALCPDVSSAPSAKYNGSEFVTWPEFPKTSVAGARHRSEVKCWKGQGRALYFVDVETGELIKKLHKDPSNNLIFPSPIVSTPAIFEADVSTSISRAFVVDADGVIWRIDMSDPGQVKGDNTSNTGWQAVPFHDIFWDLNFDDGQPSYEQPILSVDERGNVVVLVATGDTDDFEKPTAQNRVVSLTEYRDNDIIAPPPYNIRAAFNWEKRVKSGGNVPLVTSELVTGPMALFAGQLFFASFISVGTSGNTCDLGSGRLHAVDYFKRDENDANGSDPPTYGPVLLTDPGADSDADSIINVSAPVAIENLLIMGLTIIEIPTCYNVDSVDTDTYSGQYKPNVAHATPPPLYLVAQGSGDNPLLNTRAGSALKSVELQINRQNRHSRITSWATSVD